MANSYSISLIWKMCFLGFYIGIINKAISIVHLFDSSSWAIVWQYSLLNLLKKPSGVLLRSSDELTHRAETSHDMSALGWHFDMYF